MGGRGSGEWERWDRKSTVEESVTLAISAFRGCIKPHSAGIITWNSRGNNKTPVGYFVDWENDKLIMNLFYHWQDSEEVLISVRIQTTPTQFGGKRFWFTCPLVVGGAACNRLCSKLYLPPGAIYFGCRKCHNLTYRSSQEAHRRERFFANLDLRIEQSRQRIEKQKHKNSIY